MLDKKDFSQLTPEEVADYYFNLTGPWLTESQMTGALGISEAELHKLIQENNILGLQFGDPLQYYFTAQQTHKGKLLPDLNKVLAPMRASMVDSEIALCLTNSPYPFDMVIPWNVWNEIAVVGAEALIEWAETTAEIFRNYKNPSTNEAPAQEEV